MTGPQSAMGLLYTTWPDRESADHAAETLLQEGLIACANILGEARSVYRWNGEVQRETEIIALLKTSAANAERASGRIAELHPYEEPAILNVAINRVGSSPSFLNWVASQADG
jgi:periplasmic divalent cation tolerance protein